MRASKTAVIMWKFQSHFATNWKQIRIPPQGNVVKLEANEERGEGVVKSWQIYSAQGYKRVQAGKEGAARRRAPDTAPTTPTVGSAQPGHAPKGPGTSICSPRENNKPGFPEKSVVLIRQKTCRLINSGKKGKRQKERRVVFFLPVGEGSEKASRLWRIIQPRSNGNSCSLSTSVSGICCGIMGKAGEGFGQGM